MLYPAVVKGVTNNFVYAGKTSSIPGFIRFAQPVKDEELIIFFSKNRNEMPVIQSEKDGANLSRMVETVSKTRDLAFETEEETSGEVGTYVVNKKGSSVARVITLRHEPRN